MFNLLSLEAKKAARDEYLRRLATIVVGGLLIIFTFSTALLFPLLITVYSANKNTEVELVALRNRPASSNYRDFENIIKETKKAMNILKTDMLNRQHIAKMITDALESKPKGISVENIYWAKDDSGVKINLNGIAGNRELLRRYVLSLQSNKSFSKPFLLLALIGLGGIFIGILAKF